ncbi:glycosyltransferase family 39 protein [Candidatus Woesebacteria bacterium]|nr:glycosyltransferase family 39 protein [Candidatus Woesebacteria bacterium]
MKWFQKHKQTIIVLTIITAIAAFFALYKFNQVPLCMNADELAHGYNAYSLLKTGKDEFGKSFPLRLESFRDFKLPLYSYLTMPFIAIFGYNDGAVRGLNVLLSLLFVPTMYLVVKELFGKKKIAYLAALLVSINPAIHILTRHAHEGVLCIFLILWGIYFLLKFEKTNHMRWLLLTNLALFLSTFAYHFGRIFLGILVLYQGYLIIRDRAKTKQKKMLITGVLLLVLTATIPLAIDFSTSVNRVSNLFFTSNISFKLIIDELRGEDPNRLLHNKLTEGVRQIRNNYFRQISPEFLVVNGDTNARFGLKNLGPITIVEFGMFFVGLYFLFRNKERKRFFILLLFFVSPIANALTWQDPSIIRAYPLLFFLLIIVAYGTIQIVEMKPNTHTEHSRYYAISAALLMLFGWTLFNNWELYFNHYPKRPVVSRAWQCGYKEIVQFVQKNYENYDTFYITDKLGQPYIFFLHYLKYDPATYQAQHITSVPDKYGFGRVDIFDKFIFHFPNFKDETSALYIGYPDDFEGTGVQEKSVQKVTINNDTIFWIYPKGENKM